LVRGDRPTDGPLRQCRPQALAARGRTAQERPHRAAMSEEKPNDAEEQFTTWLAACDDALAAGSPPPPLVHGPKIAPRGERETRRAQDDLACAQLLREVLGGLPTLRADFGSEGDTGAASLLALSDPLAHGSLPWQTLGRFQLRRELGRGGCGV